MVTGQWNRRNFMKVAILQAGVISGRLGSQSKKSPAPKPLVAFRVFTPLWLTDDRFRALLNFFARRPGVVDELAFFTSATHAPLPLDEIKRRSERLAKIL